MAVRRDGRDGLIERIVRAGFVPALTIPDSVCRMSGTVTKGDKMQQHTDGTWITDAASGARVVSLVALESGVSGDIIEAAMLTPITLS